jgi:hypothetical protein
MSHGTMFTNIYVLDCANTPLGYQFLNILQRQHVVANLFVSSVNNASWKQGDRIERRRIFAHGVIVYFRQFFEI